MMESMKGELAKEGMHASEKAIQGYIGFHHLLLSLAQEYPQMRETANEKIANYIRHPVFRTKLLAPGNGELIGLCSISDRYSWSDMCEAYCSEAFIRRVKWYVQKHPDTLANLPALKCNSMHATKRRQIKRDVIRRVFEATTTGQQWLMFQVMFLEQVARPSVTVDGATQRASPDEVLHRYNATLGAIEPSLLTILQQQAKVISACSTFREHFHAIQHPRYGNVPTEFGDQHNERRDVALNAFEVQLYDLFRNAEQASLLRQYHRPARRGGCGPRRF